MEEEFGEEREGRQDNQKTAEIAKSDRVITYVGKQKKTDLNILTKWNDLDKLITLLQN